MGLSARRVAAAGPSDQVAHADIVPHDRAPRLRLVQISPSILSADFANLERELERVANADWAHVDVMDGHFVPNLTIGLPVVEALIKVSPIPLDAHLMIEDPDRWAPMYAEAGCQSVTFHIEAARDPRALSRALRAVGVRAGMAVEPRTDFAPYADLLPEVDMVLVMTVEPGFGGSPSWPTRCRRSASPRGRRASWRGDLDQVDGGVSADTIEQCAEAGADVFVAGSAVYGSRTPPPPSTSCARWSRRTPTEPSGIRHLPAWPPSRGRGVGLAVTAVHTGDYVLPGSGVIPSRR